MAIERINICVFGASSRDLEQRYVDDAYHLGTLIAQRGWACYNGAGCEGLMRAVSDGALDAGGEAIGVIPQFMVDNGWHYDRLTRIITTSDMHQRKLTLAQSTQAVIALPGGCGTLEELLEAITWRQLNLAPKPRAITTRSPACSPQPSSKASCARATTAWCSWPAPPSKPLPSSRTSSPMLPSP